MYTEFNDNLYKYDYTEIRFNIEDVCVILYTNHNSDDSQNFVLEKLYERKQYADFHRHPYIEAHFSFHNTFNIYFPENKFVVREHSLVAVSPDTSHYIESENFSDTICLSFLFERNNLKTECSLYDKLKKVFDAPYVYIPNLKNFADNAKKILTSMEDGNIFMLSYLFHQLIYAILTAKNMLTYISPDQLLPDSEVSRYRKIEYYIDENFDTNISVKDLADKLNLSERQTSRIVRKMYSLSFNDVIAAKRIKKACRYLRDKNLPITAISTLVGYTSIRCFYIAFKKLMGCLPSEYRKNI